MTFPYGEPVEFVRAGARAADYSGEMVRDDWENPESMLTAVAAVAPAGSTELPGADRDPVDADLELLIEGTVTVERTWRAILRGGAWDVAGSPEQYVNPWTGWGGTVVKVKRRDG